MFSYTITEGSTVFADQFRFETRDIETFTVGDCANCKDILKTYIATVTYEGKTTQRKNGEVFYRRNYVYRDNGPRICPRIKCGTEGFVGGYSRVNFTSSNSFTNINSDGRKTFNKTIYVNDDGKAVVSVVSVDQPVMGTKTMWTTTIENKQMYVPTTKVYKQGNQFFETDFYSFTIVNNKIQPTNGFRDTISYTETVAPYKKTVLTEKEYETIIGWSTSYSYKPCGECSEVTIKEAVDAENPVGTRFYNTAFILTNYNPYWYRDRKDLIQNPQQKTQILKFAQKGNPANKRNEFTISYLNVNAFTLSKIPLLTKSDISYNLVDKSEKANIAAASFETIQEGRRPFAFGKTVKQQQSYFTTSNTEIVTKTSQALEPSTVYPAKYKSIGTVTSVTDIRFSEINYNITYKTTENLEVFLQNNIYNLLYSEKNFQRIESYISYVTHDRQDYRLTNRHNVKHLTIFDRFNLYGLVSPAEISLVYNNVVLKDNKANINIPIGNEGLSYLRNLEIPLSKFVTFESNSITYDVSKISAIDIFSTTKTVISNKNTTTNTTITDLFQGEGAVAMKSFYSLREIDPVSSSLFAISYANLGGVCDNGEIDKFITRIYSPGDFIKIEQDNFSPVFFKKPLTETFSNINTVNYFPTFVIEKSVVGEAGTACIISEKDIYLPRLIELLNGSDETNSAYKANTFAIRGQIDLLYNPVEFYG